MSFHNTAQDSKAFLNMKVHTPDSSQKNFPIAVYISPSQQNYENLNILNNVLSFILFPPHINTWRAASKFVL